LKQSRSFHRSDHGTESVLAACVSTDFDKIGLLESENRLASVIGNKPSTLKNPLPGQDRLCGKNLLWTIVIVAPGGVSLFGMSNSGVPPAV
jgi:hypothetical protein